MVLSHFDDLDGCTGMEKCTIAGKLGDSLISTIVPTGWQMELIGMKTFERTSSRFAVMRVCFSMVMGNSIVRGDDIDCDFLREDGKGPIQPCPLRI